MEKGRLGPRPSDRLLLKDGTGGDPTQPPASHTSRVSFCSRLQVQQPPSPDPPARGDRRSRHSRLHQRAGSHPSSPRLVRGSAPRSRVRSPVQLPPPANTAARGQCRRLRSCVACSGRAGLATSPAVPSTPPTPASIDTEPLLVHRSAQTEPPAPERSDAAERTDRDTQTESPAPERRGWRVPLLVERETQTERPVPLPSPAPAAPRDPELPGRRQRLSLFRRLLRACRGSCTREQPEQLGAKRAQHPQGATQGLAPGIGVLMVLQEPAEDSEWYPYSWPWLVETAL